MKNADNAYTNILNEVLLKGSHRHTRSGDVITLFSPPEFRYDMSDGTLSLLTGKQVPLNPLVGELLWFLNGETSLDTLSFRNWGEVKEDKWTIWTNDYNRWGHTSLDRDLGRLYGLQWRSFAGHDKWYADQIALLIERLREDPYSRYHNVSAWNAADIESNAMALPPCHVMFQCYVSNDGRLSLKWYQRSVDIFLGLPFNIASYGLLLKILCEITGYKEGELIGTFGDAHIYDGHMEAVQTYLNNPKFDSPVVEMPQILDLEDIQSMTALDFIDGLSKNYKHSGIIKAPLSVG